MTTREGNLEAPTRHPLDWRNPEFYDEEALLKEMERVFDICHGCRRCVSLCHVVPDAVRPRRREQDDGGRRRRQGRLLEGRRPVLPVRRLLHDEVPVRAAAPVEPRLPAPDAAREGGEVPAGRRALPRPAAHQHRPPGQARDDPRRRADGQQGQHDAGRRARRWTRCSASPPSRGCRRTTRKRFRKTAKPSVAWPVRDGERTPGKVAIFSTCYVNYNEPGIGHDLRQDPRAQRDPVPDRREGGLLRHAQARARRPRVGRAAEERQHPGARRARARRLRDPHAGAVVHADVQAGAAADVPRRRGREGGRRGDVRSRSSTSCCATRTGC